MSYAKVKQCITFAQCTNKACHRLFDTKAWYAIGRASSGQHPVMAVVNACVDASGAMVRIHASQPDQTCFSTPETQLLSTGTGGTGVAQTMPDGSRWARGKS